MYSIIRTVSKVKVKPLSSSLCYVKTSPGFDAKSVNLIQVTGIDDCLLDEPLFTVQETVSKIPVETNKIPVLLVNRSTRHVQLRKGCVIGKISTVNPSQCHVSTQKVDNEADDLLAHLQCADEHKQVISDLLKRNSDRLAQSDLDLGQTDTVRMDIETDNHPPIALRPYRIPLLKRESINKAIDGLLEAGIIERSQSAWSFPLVVVKKKDGTDRLCVDFRALNKVVKPVSFPMPLIR